MSGGRGMVRRSCWVRGALGYGARGMSENKTHGLWKGKSGTPAKKSARIWEPALMAGSSLTIVS